MALLTTTTSLQQLVNLPVEALGLYLTAGNLALTEIKSMVTKGLHEVLHPVQGKLKILSKDHKNKM